MTNPACKVDRSMDDSFTSRTTGVSTFISHRDEIAKESAYHVMLLVALGSTCSFDTLVLMKMGLGAMK
jgi:hypothetical protein